MTREQSTQGRRVTLTALDPGDGCPVPRGLVARPADSPAPRALVAVSIAACITAAGGACGETQKTPIQGPAPIRAQPYIEPIYESAGVMEEGPLVQVAVCEPPFQARVDSLEAYQPRLLEIWEANLEATHHGACKNALSTLLVTDPCPDPGEAWLQARETVDRCLVAVAKVPRIAAEVLVLAGVDVLSALDDKQVGDLLSKLKGEAACTALKTRLQSKTRKTSLRGLSATRASDRDVRREFNECFLALMGPDGAGGRLSPSLLKVEDIPGPAAGTGLAGVTAPLGLEAALLSGMADFVADRAKQEVLVYVIDEFGRKLCARELKGYAVRTFFPESCHLLSGEAEVTGDTLQQIGGAFQAALQADIQGLLPVVLNFAANVPAGGQGLNEPVLTYVVKLVAEIERGREPLALMAGPRLNIELGKVQTSCAANHEPACALQFFIHLVRTARQAEKCEEDSFSEDECLAAIKKGFTEELKDGHSLKNWIGKHKISDAIEKASATLHAFRDLRNAQVEARAEKFWALVHTVVEFLPPDEAKEFRRMDPLVRRWGALGLALYRTIQGVARGGDPLALLIAAFEALPCEASADSLCAFRAAGVLLETVTTTGGLDRLDKLVADDRIDPNELAAFLRDAENRWKIILGRSSNVHVRTWVNQHWTEWSTESPALHIPATLTARRVSDLVAQALQVWHQLYRATKLAKTMLDQAPPDQQTELRRQAAVMIAEASFDLWRVIVPLVVEQGQQARALAVINGISAAFVAAREHEWASFVRSVYALAREVSTEDPIPAPLRRYVPLITALAEAKTSEDVSAALEKFAAPVGSYRAKLKPGWHGSVSAMVGAVAGTEYVSSWDGHASIFAPVGLDITYKGWGAHLTVIDIGALTATRLGLRRSDADGDGDEDEKRAELPEPRFSQVLAPGLHLRGPLWDSPLVWGIGGSIIPALRGSDETAETGYRFHVFLAVDVTMLPFDIGSGD